MRFVFLGIVLAFPFLDLYATVRFARWTGVPLWLWLGLSTIMGFLLLRNERLAFRARTAAAMHGDQALLRGLLDSGRKVLAGVLLLMPGVLSDLVALVLLALPLNIGQRLETGFAPGPRRRGGAIDGEYRRLD